MPSDRLRYRKRFGLRTFGMLICAYVWLLLAAGQLQGISIPRPGVFHLDWTGTTRALLWGIPALIAFITAWSRRYSWVGVAPLFLMPALTAGSYSASWVESLIAGGGPGYHDSFYIAAIWWASMLLPILVACIPSPNAVPHMPEAGR